MLHPLLSLEGRNMLGLVLTQKQALGFTQVIELNWSLKIGTRVNQIMIPMIVFIFGGKENGLIILALPSYFSFASLSN